MIVGVDGGALLELPRHTHPAAQALAAGLALLRQEIECGVEGVDRPLSRLCAGWRLTQPLQLLALGRERRPLGLGPFNKLHQQVLDCAPE